MQASEVHPVEKQCFFVYCAERNNENSSIREQ